MASYVGSGSILSRLAVRFFIGFAVCAITLTVLGMIDVGKDAFGSHKNFADMQISDFRSGDIVHGYITESLGCAASTETTTYTMHVIETDKYISGYYYVIPFYDASSDDPFPNKLIFYKTGNRKQYDTLDQIFDDTVERYMGWSNGSGTSLFVDRAEVKSMSSEETDAFKSYIEMFVEAYYEDENAQTIDYAKKAYSEAIVPYLVQYSAGGGYTILMIGLVMIVILIITVLVFISKTRSAKSSLPESIYIGANDPNLNAPTGLPQQTYTAAPTRTPRQTSSFKTDYSNSQRPMPPIAGKPDQPRVVGYDPQTGKPIYSLRPEAPRPTAPPKPQTMDSIDLKNTDLVDITNGGIDKSADAPIPVNSADNSYSMQSIDPKASSASDFVLSEEWQFRNDMAEMPMNGNIPVINPDSRDFGEDLPIPEPEQPHPTEKPDEFGDLLVEQTDPSMRSQYFASKDTSGTMNTVDLRTETNVDSSNGGIERDITDIRTDFPTSEPAPRAEPAPQTAPKEPERDDYNIFKTSDSSYNIFKSNDQPPLDISFPKTDKDDFKS